MISHENIKNLVSEWRRLDGDGSRSVHKDV